MERILAVVCLSFFFIHPSGAQCPLGCFGCRLGTSRITCASAQLSTFPEIPLDQQNSVTDLNVRSNMITSLSAMDLDNFISLTELDLSFNMLISIEPGSFDSTVSLRNLDLTGNRLTVLPDDLFVSTSLIMLNLDQNNVGNISSATFNGLQEFSSIYLRDNVIRRIPEGTFSQLGRIQELDLSGNPLLCDCGLRWLPAFLRDNSLLIPLIGTCDVPTRLNGVNLRSLNEDDFVCECSPACVNGSCILSTGECLCNDGFTGDDCSTECPAGTYGDGCQSTCNCVSEHESNPCDHVDGTCHCRPGYTVASCEQECPEGSYGQDCLEVCQCQNGASCDFTSGFCNCTIGFMGVFCDTICPPLLYGLGCSQQCNCATGNCHHITGVCACPIGFYGTNCNHNCTGVPDCSGEIGREECSESTPEQTCGPCLQGYVGDVGVGNTECILCLGAPDCQALNRHPCGQTANTCGPCYQRHFGESGNSNQPCFDPCTDGIRNYEETDIDCGGSLCPSCQLGDVCTTSVDCGDRSVCLGAYEHPSQLDFPFNPRDSNTCVADEFPGQSLLNRFKAAFQGRENPFLNANLFSDRDTLEQQIEQEIQIQFEIGQQLESIEVTDLEQRPGEPLYQTNIELSGSDLETEQILTRVIQNIHNGKLKGTVLLNRSNKKVLFNI